MPGRADCMLTRNRRKAMTRILTNLILALCVVVTWDVGVYCQTPSRYLRIDDVFNLQLAVDPQISPDGKRIIYVRQFCDIMSDRRHSNLWIINFDGSDHRALTTGN